MVAGVLVDQTVTAAIAGMGVALPEARLTNADLEATLDTSDEWIVERTGIRERRIAADGETSVTLAVEAGTRAIKDSGLAPGDIGLLIVATLSPPQRLPAAAAFVQNGIGLDCGAFDLNAACSGFVYALVMADAFLGAGRADSVLVIGSEVLTPLVDPGDRTTRILFGDAAAAAVLVAAPEGFGLLGCDVGCDGSAAGILEIGPGQPYVRMEGNEVFRRAVRACSESAAVALAKSGLSAADVDLFVPHQANGRIIDAVVSRLGIAPDRVARNVERYGNTSAASIPLALAEAAPAHGDIVLLSGFGAGMTWASAVLRWCSA